MDLHLISRVIWPRLFQNENWLAVNVLFEVCSTKYYICFHPGFWRGTCLWNHERIRCGLCAGHFWRIDWLLFRWWDCFFFLSCENKNLYHYYFLQTLTSFYGWFGLVEVHPKEKTSKKTIITHHRENSVLIRTEAQLYLIA